MMTKFITYDDQIPYQLISIPIMCINDLKLKTITLAWSHFIVEYWPATICQMLMWWAKEMSASTNTDFGQIITQRKIWIIWSGFRH